MVDHDPLTDPLTDLLDRALDDVGPVEVDGLAERLEARRVRRRRRRRATRLVPLAAAAVALAVIATVLVRHEPPAQVTTDDGTQATVELGTFGFAPGWHELDPGPLGTSGVATAAWTGEELVVLFGSVPDPVPQPDGLPGAAFDPSTRSWRSISPMPLPAGNLESVWTGSELIVVRTATTMTSRLPDAAAAWDAATDTWRLLPAPPPIVATGLVGLGWTGTEALFPSRLARFDVTTSSWRAMPPLPPDSSGRFFGGWTGSRFVMARTSGVGVTLSWDPSSTAWAEEAPPPPLEAIGAIATGDRLIVARSSFDGAGGTAYDATTGRWNGLPPFQAPQQLCPTSVVAIAGTAAVQWCSTVAILGSDRWIDVGLPDQQRPPGTMPGMPGNYLGTLVGAGDVLLGYGDWRDPDRTSFDLYVPDADRVPGSTPVPPPPSGPRPDGAPAWASLRIGSATLDVPSGYAVVDGTDRPGQITIQPPIEPGWPSERPCTIRSVRAADDPAMNLGALRARSSQPEVDHVNTQFGRPAGAFLAAGDVDGDEHVIVSVSADEVIDIACARLLTSIELAQYLR